MQKVMIVNGTEEVLDLFEAMPGAGYYDVVFVESSAHAYSQVKRERPSLVIVCLRLDDPSGFQVISMIKLDEDTKAIPVLACTSEYGEGDTHSEPAGYDESDMLDPIPAASMN